MRARRLITFGGRLILVAAALALAPISLAQDLVITTVAGGDFVFRGDGGPATQVQLSQMYHAITDSQGNILVADRSNHQVVKIAPTGILTVIAGNGIEGYSGDDGPATRASLSFPSALALDRAGNLYIGDQGNYRIRRVSPEGVIVTIAGNGIKRFAGDGGPALDASIDKISGLAVDAAGNIYFTENDVHRVRRIAADGIVRTFAGNGTGAYGGDGGPATQASLREPWHLALDAAGNLLIADFRNHRVRRVTPAGVISTIAGNGTAGSTGNDGPALQASITGPAGIFIDASNNLYIAGFDSLVRAVSPSGVIRTFAGTGTAGFSGDGGAAAQARISNPTAVTGDTAGNIFIVDSVNLRVRRVTPQGTISTFAGAGQHRYSGDGGQAVAAAIGFPLGLAVDADNNVYISDTNNNRVRKVAPNGIISTIAGTGLASFSGDNGPSTQAALNYPIGLAADAASNIYIADLLNGRVRRIARSGVITTVAGGVPFTQLPSDGQQATLTAISPESIAVDGAGNLFIFDPALCVVFRVTPGGAIFRHAGQYLACGSTGDGGPATSAKIMPEGGVPGSIAVDSRGVVYLAETNSGRVRRVGLDGVIRTVAGGVPQTRLPIDGEPALTAPLFQPAAVFADDSGAFLVADVSLIYLVVPDGRILHLAGDILAGSLGDGGPALNAGMLPGAMTFDQNGNLLFIDLDNFRVRAILVTPPSLTAAPGSLQFTAQSGGAPPLAQTVAVTASIPSVGFFTQVTTSDGRPWLRASPASGASPRLVDITADPAGLVPGTYQGMIAIRSPLATPAQRSVSVAFEVTPGQPPQLDLDKQNFSFGFPLNAASRTQTLTVRNVGGGALDFAATAATSNGGDWLSVNTDTSQALPAAPVTVTVTAAPGNLPAGTYTGRISVSTAAETRSVPLAMTISANDRAVLLSQSGLSFTAVAGGGIVPPRTFEALNIGRGVVAFTVSTTTLSGGASWLSATPRSGSIDAAAQSVPSVEVRVNQAGLEPSSYYGLVQVDAPGAANSPQVITVFLEVLPAGSDPGPQIEPAELVFTAVAGRSSPGSKDVFVYNVAGAPKTFRSSATLAAPDSAVDVRMVNLPSDLTLAVDQPNRVIVQPLIGNLPPGVYLGGVNLQFTDGRVRTVRVQVIVTAPEARGALRFAAACTATRLLPAITSLTPSAPVTVGWPVPITAEVRDDCGAIHDSGSVVVSFSNGDPVLNLLSLQDGRWTGTWNARGSASATSLKLEAVNVARQIRGEVTLSVDSRTRQEPPVVDASGVVSAVGLQPYVPVAPGGIISIFGERLADVTQPATAAPLPKQIGSTQVLMGGLPLPLLSVSPTQIDAVTPVGLALNTSHQLLVQRGSTIARPVSLDVAPAQPAVAVDSITWVRPGTGETGRARPGTPARAGDLLVINATGLGLTDPVVADGEAAPDSPRAQTRDAVTAAIGGVPAPVESAGLAPGLVGLYQVNARVPEGVPAGDQAPVVLTVSGQSSPPVTIAVQ